MEKEVEETINNARNNDNNFQMGELKLAIKSLKNNKAAGPDGIPGELIKNCTENVFNIILKILNKIKSTGKYPEGWGIGLTSLILKEGDDEDPNNYRAITVTDTITKILAIMINNRLEEWASKNKIIRQEQIGFQKKCRPADHIFVLKTLMNTHLEKGKKIYSCFIDFKKAYDSVWRTGLFYKLIKTGADLDLIKIIKSMYEQSKQTLLLNGKLTRTFKTWKGVKQGCILSPRLFNIFINDIPGIFDATCTPLELGNEILNCLMMTWLSYQKQKMDSNNPLINLRNT